MTHRARCQRKRRYRNHAQAQAVVVRMRAQGFAQDRPIQAYRCPFGPHWHVGHMLSLEGLEQLAREIRGLDGT